MQSLEISSSLGEVRVSTREKPSSWEFIGAIGSRWEARGLTGFRWISLDYRWIDVGFLEISSSWVRFEFLRESSQVRGNSLEPLDLVGKHED